MFVVVVGEEVEMVESVVELYFVCIGFFGWMLCGCVVMFEVYMYFGVVYLDGMFKLDDL